MKKLIFLITTIALTGLIAGGTIWMLNYRNNPRPPPPDPTPCLTEARLAGLTGARLAALEQVARRDANTLETIQVREELRRRDLPACEWILQELGAGR